MHHLRYNTEQQWKNMYHLRQSEGSGHNVPIIQELISLRKGGSGTFLRKVDVNVTVLLEADKQFTRRGEEVTILLEADEQFTRRGRSHDSARGR